MKLFSGIRLQAGDTLVEVAMAIAILGMVLVSSFNVASAAFRMGQGAKERTQAANLVQEQAEALRNYRDSHRWSDPLVADDVLDRIVAIGGFGARFHMQHGPGGWNFASGPRPQLDSVHRVFITAQPSPFPDFTDRLRFEITAEWVPPGGSTAHTCPSGFAGECTTITTYLVNLDNFAPAAP
jgi:type II secretory pathway pseudopilin PulG